VGDIDIAYKIFGKGKPLLLIPGFSMTLGMWDPNMLNMLSSNHTIIIFDNRGIGQTTAGNDPQKFSISQFANDTAGFLTVLELAGGGSSSNTNSNQQIDIIGLSLGGFIAQEFAIPIILMKVEIKENLWPTYSLDKQDWQFSIS
jgi:pimeloyl-ACP methyl ester carboxylesterase